MRDRALGSTIRLKFTTTDSNGAPVAPSSAFGPSDFRIYKDGSASEKTSTNGISVTSPFDSVVGRHLIEIDTSNSTGDSGFWASGSAYFVELNTAKTVNSQSVSGLEIGSFSLELQTAQANLTKILGTSLTESVAGYLAAGFKKLLDVATPVFTLASVNQTGDSFARLGAPAGASVSADLLTLLNRLTSTRAGLLDNLDVAISVIQSQITALNNLSAKCNWFGSLLLEIPDSGTRAYVFELVVKDDEDKLVNLDASPTITLVNSAGTDRSSLITTMIANPSTGRYTLTITVGTSTTTEALKLTATGTVSGETRYAVLMTQVVDYDSATMINSIYTRIGAPAGASLAADVAAVKTVADTVAADTTTLKSRITSTLFSGITYLGRWLGLLAGKTADSSTLAEINATTAGAGYNNTTDSLEAIKDAGTGGGGGSGDASQTTLLEVQATVEDIAATLSGTPIEATSRVASGGTITAYIGDDFRVRSDTELSISTSDVGGVLYTKWIAIGEENLYFGASREGSDAGAISGTVAAITSVGSGASQTVKLTVEITNCGSGLKPGTYEYQIEQRQAHGSDTDSFIEIAGSLILKRNSVA